MDAISMEGCLFWYHYNPNMNAAGLHGRVGISIQASLLLHNQQPLSTLGNPDPSPSKLPFKLIILNVYLNHTRRSIKGTFLIFNPSSFGKKPSLLSKCSSNKHLNGCYINTRCAEIYCCGTGAITGLPTLPVRFLLSMWLATGKNRMLD